MFDYVRYLQLRTLQAHLNAVLASALPWDAKYRQVFSDACSGNIYHLLKEMGERLEYYDPDADYEDDVRAFASAVDDKLEQLLAEFKRLDIHAAYAAFGKLVPMG